MRLLAISLAVLGALGAARGARADSATEARARAERAADDLAERLLRELGAALEGGGGEAAIAVCADAAPRLAEAVADEHGVTIRRTALRARNSANEPDPYERAWLDARAAEIAAGGKAAPSAEVVDGAARARELRYLRPILFPGAPCAQCHGTPDGIAPAVREAIAKRYPGDRATGFRPGDLRGAFTVRVPLE